MKRLDTKVIALHGAIPIKPLKVVMFLYNEKTSYWRVRDDGVSHLSAVDDHPNIWTVLHKFAWHGVPDLLFTHPDGKRANDQVKVVGPRYNNTGDSGHTDLKHVSQHLLLQACTKPFS